MRVARDAAATADLFAAPPTSRRRRGPQFAAARAGEPVRPDALWYAVVFPRVARAGTGGAAAPPRVACAAIHLVRQSRSRRTPVVGDPRQSAVVRPARRDCMPASMPVGARSECGAGAAAPAPSPRCGSPAPASRRYRGPRRRSPGRLAPCRSMHRWEASACAFAPSACAGSGSCCACRAPVSHGAWVRRLARYRPGSRATDAAPRFRGPRALSGTSGFRDRNRGGACYWRGRSNRCSNAACDSCAAAGRGAVLELWMRHRASPATRLQLDSRRHRRSGVCAMCSNGCAARAGDPVRAVELLSGPLQPLPRFLAIRGSCRGAVATAPRPYRAAACAPRRERGLRRRRSRSTVRKGLAARHNRSRRRGARASGGRDARDDPSGVAAARTAASPRTHRRAAARRLILEQGPERIESGWWDGGRSRATITSRAAAEARGCGSSRSGTQALVPARRIRLSGRGDVRRAARPEQLLLPARRLASRELVRRRRSSATRARTHRRVLARRRGARPRRRQGARVPLIVGAELRASMA